MTIRMARALHVCLLISACCTLPGCLFSPLSRQVRLASLQIDAIEQRITQLETIPILGSSAVSRTGAPAGAAVGVVPAAFTGTPPGLLSGGGVTRSVTAVDTLTPGSGAPLIAVQGEAASGGRLTLPGLSFQLRGALTKLIRGLTNIVTGWVEVPKRVQETSGTSGAASGFSFGLLRGLGYGFIRTVGGVYEVATFPFPAPSGYRAVMRPDYVFVCACDEPAP